MSRADYYQEAFQIAMEEAGCWNLVEQMTREQCSEVGASIATSAEHSDQAFYTPPPSDRIAVIEREKDERYRALEAEYQRYRDNAKGHVKRILRVHRDDPVTINSDGIYRHGGRTVQIA